MPEIVSELIDVPDAQLTNLGSKGLGEPPIVPTAAAIANAIRDATGARGPRAADHARGDAARARARRSGEGAAWSSGGRLTLDELGGGTPIAGGTEVVPLLRAQAC